MYASRMDKTYGLLICVLALIVTVVSAQVGVGLNTDNEGEGKVHLPDGTKNLPEKNRPEVWDSLKKKPEVAAMKPALPKADVKSQKNKKLAVKIDEAPECAEDVKRFCADKVSNFMILDCLQNDERTDSKLSEPCHHFLWDYKINLTRDIMFDHASHDACAPELAKIPECNSLEKGKGKIIPCLIEHYDEIQSKPCNTFINKMASIIFSDYRFMEFFIIDCIQDIHTHRCGRMDPANDDDDSPHSQGQTVACLGKHRKTLAKKCKKALLRVAEIQSDDYHLDRPLYYACMQDRENLCAKVPAGNGAVFKCLYKHLGDKMLSDGCRSKLEDRQQLISEDVKADKSFYDSCSRDIKSNNCSHLRDQSDEDEDLTRSTILLCLERAQNNGKKVRPECLQEMFELRTELMQDYKISPELVDACKNEISEFCDGLEPGGNTIECLMKEAMDKGNKGTFSAACSAQIRTILHLANPGEDIRLDRPLQRACGEVVSSACRDRPAGQGDVITCLLENLDHEDMTDECEEHLLQLQYFAVRDFKLDHHLFKQCRHDAKTLCSAEGFDDPRSMTPDQGPMIFTCLHTLMRSKDPQDTKPSRGCIHEIRRVMRERSMRINLMPEVEEACITELAEECSDDDEHTEKDGEMECLQMNMEKLSPKCQQMVSKFTEEEMEDIEMDRILMKACRPMIRKFCMDKLDNDAMPNEVLECLIEFKHHHEMDNKCAIGIEHHQIISLKDFKFNRKFQDACQRSVATLCPHKRTKYDVVSCLSEIVRNDTLFEKPHRVEKQCQRQLKSELLQRGESITLDHDLEKACRGDVVAVCKDKHAGAAEVIECLKEHKKKLSEECHKVLFKREKESAAFGDYTVHRTCRKMIERYCDEEGDEGEIMDCLKEHKDLDTFDERCRQIVLRRQVEQTKDFRLNPHLQKACRLDIPKFCAELYNGETDDVELEGKVIDCLKKKYISKNKILSKDCEHEIKSRVKEAALDINQNPVVMKVCKQEIKKNCLEEIANVHKMEIDSEQPYNTFGTGSVVECLKRNFQKLKNKECQKEVAFMISESRVDVHVDPLLHSTCQQDIISLCKTVSAGQGKQMSCLLANLEESPELMTRNCREMLSRRKDLWEYAAQLAPVENLSELYDQISASPSRNYFILVLFSMVVLFFSVGITCGRVTKRVSAQIKNK